MPTEDEIESNGPGNDDVHADARAALNEVNNIGDTTATDTGAVETKPEPEAVKPEPEKTAAERARDEQGRFVAKKDGEQPEQKPVVEAKPVLDAKTPTPEPPEQIKPPEQQQVAPSAPPPGWSIKSKAEWDKLPPHIRDDIGKRELEVSKGFAEYSGLKPFIQRARQSGQTLQQALTSYVGIEDALRRDADGGFIHIASNLGLTQHQAAQMFARVAGKLGFQNAGPQPQPAGATGDTPRLPADQNADLQQLLSPILAPVLQEVNQLKTALAQQSEFSRTQGLTRAKTAIEQFRSNPAHKYYDNLEDDIANLLQSGMVKRSGDAQADLKTAYDMACKIHPEISELLTSERLAKSEEDKRARDKEAADKARNASRSVNGSPSPGASDVRKNKEGDRLGSKSYDDDLHEDVRAAVRATGALA